MILDAGIKCTLRKFANDAELGGAVDSLKCREAFQGDVDRPKSWAISSHMKFNNSKRQILYWGQGDPSYKYKQGEQRLKSSPTERDLGIWVDGKLSMSQYGSQRGQPCPRVHQSTS